MENKKLHHWNQKNTTGRFVYKMQNTPNSYVATAEAEMSAEAKKAGEEMAGSKHTADKIAQKAKDQLAKIFGDTTEKMGLNTTEDMNHKDNEPFVAKLTELQVKAGERIDANLAKYENHVKAATLRITLETNYKAFEELKDSRDLSAISILINVANGLDDERDIIEDYAPPEDKDVMLTNLNDQVITFRKKAKEMAEQHIDNMGDMDEALAQAEMKAEKKDPTLSSQEISKIWDFTIGLQKLHASLANIPGMEDMAANAKAKYDYLFSRLQALHVVHTRRSPELVAANEKRVHIWKALKEARAKNEEVQNNPKSTEEEKKRASNEFETFQLAHTQHNAYFRRLNMAVDEMDLPWGEHVPEDIVVAAHQPERKIEGKSRLAVNNALENVEDANTVKDIKRAMIRLGTLIAEHGLDDLSIRRRLQDLGFSLPPLGADTKEFRLVYYDPDTGDRFERSVQPFTKPVELEEKLADIRKKGIPILNDLDTRSTGTSLSIMVDGIPVKITKLAHREYKVGGKVINALKNEASLYTRIMTVALRKKRIRAARAVPGVRYVKAEKKSETRAA